MNARILVLDDDAASRNAIEARLVKSDYFCKSISFDDDPLEAAELDNFDAIVFDPETDVIGAEYLFEELRRRQPSASILLYTKNRDFDVLRRLVTLGIAQFVAKDEGVDALLASLFEILGAGIDGEMLDISAAGDDGARSKLAWTLGIYRRCEPLLSILSVDQLFDAIIDLAMKECNAQAGIIYVAEERSEANLLMVGARGLIDADDELAAFDLSTLEIYKRLLNGRATYGKAGEMLPEQSDVPSNEIFAPVMLGERLAGLLKLTHKQDAEAFGPQDLVVLAIIGHYAAIALRNGLQVREIEKHTLRDRSTQAYNLSYFLDYVEKEAYKSRRYDRQFSVVHVSIDNYEKLLRQFGARETAEALERFIEALSEALREADMVARAADNEFFVLLPETDFFGSLMSIRRIRKSISGHKHVANPNGAMTMAVLLTSAAFPGDGGSFEDLVEVMRARTAVNRNSVYVKQNLESKSFWQIVEEFAGKEEYYKREGTRLRLPDSLARLNDREGLTRHCVFSPEDVNELQRFLAYEVMRNPQLRGILYMSHHVLTGQSPFVDNFNTAIDAESKIFLCGRKELAAWSIPRITPIYLEDEYIEKYFFALFLNERYAYAALAQKGSDGHYYGFQSSDQMLTENLIEKLQDEYYMQKQL